MTSQSQTQKEGRVKRFSPEQESFFCLVRDELAKAAAEQERARAVRDHWGFHNSPMTDIERANESLARAAVKGATAATEYWACRLPRQGDDGVAFIDLNGRRTIMPVEDAPSLPQPFEG